MFAACCSAPANNKAAADAAEVVTAPNKSAEAQRRTKRRKIKRRGMLSRILEGIAGLVEDDDYTTASEGSSPDTGHLTASLSGGGSRRASARGEPAAGASWQQRQQQQQQQQQRRQREEDEDEEEEEEEEEEDQEESGWNILGGVPFLPSLVQLLSPRAGTAEEEARAAAQQLEQQALQTPAEQEPPVTPGGTSRFPTLAEQQAAPQAEDADLQGTTTEPAPLTAGQQPLPQLSEPSTLMSDEHICSIAAAVPARYRQSRWTLLYSTARDGISLQTLLRHARSKAPTVLVVRDFDKHVFGAYCSEPWKLDKHYFGTGETFVFQLAPRTVAWYWWWRRMAKEANDYFQWASPEAIAVGGAGGYALWLDADLSAGISRNSTTFGNDSLAGAEEFKIGAVELWGLS